jgi:hypothetical protein
MRRSLAGFARVALAPIALAPAVLGFVVLSNGAALAEPGDPHVVQGTLEWPSAAPAGVPFIVVRGDDGRAAYCADLTAAQRRMPDALTAGTRVALLGIEGARPHELTAMVIGAGDASSLGLAPAFTRPSSGSPAVTAGARATGATPAPAAVNESMWRVDGIVQSVSGTSVTLRAADGSTPTVDVSNLSRGTLQALRPGEQVSLFGVPRPDQRLVATGYIQSDTVPPSASPPMR